MQFPIDISTYRLPAKPELGSGVYINYFSETLEKGIPEALKKYIQKTAFPPQIHHIDLTKKYDIDDGCTYLYQLVGVEVKGILKGLVQSITKTMVKKIGMETYINMMDDYDDYLDLSLDQVLKGEFDGTYKIDFNVEGVEEEEEEESED